MSFPRCTRCGFRHLDDEECVKPIDLVEGDPQEYPVGQCQFCGQPIVPKDGRRRYRAYCCPKHRQAAYRRRLKGGETSRNRSEITSTAEGDVEERQPLGHPCRNAHGGNGPNG